MSEEKPKKDESDWGWIVPVSITAVWFVFVAWYLNLPYQKDKDSEKLYWIAKIAAQDPSSFGDFLSGAFAPVAFLWLAYSVWIQKQELALTRNVMKEQETALRDSSISNAALARETKIQNELEIQKIKLSQMESLVEHFYSICKMMQNIPLNDVNRGNFGFDVAYRGNNGQPHNYTCFEISRRIKQSISHLKLQKIDLMNDEDLNNIRSFYRITNVIKELFNASEANKSIFLAHGLDGVVRDLKMLNEEVNFEG